jgi:translation elongation factor EF-1alpha
MQNGIFLSKCSTGLYLKVIGSYPISRSTVSCGALAGEAFSREYSWCVDDSADNIEDRVQCIWNAVDTNEANTTCRPYDGCITTVSTLPARLGETATAFPCTIISSWFDHFAIVRAPQSFVVHSLLLSKDSGRGGGGDAAIFCAQEVWELCRVGGHAPGLSLSLMLPNWESSFTMSTIRHRQQSLNFGPSSNKESTRSVGNMILVHAYTPLLFALYTHYGRCLASSVNVTGDILALTAVSLQWARFYCDGTIVACQENYAQSSLTRQDRHAWLLESLRSFTSFSYALQWRVAAWATGMEYVNGIFSSYYNSGGKGTEIDFAGTPRKLSEANYMDQVVISRELVSGLLCPLAVAALLTCCQEGNTDAQASVSSKDPRCWNLIIRTIFSRMCEAISGSKIIRSNVVTASLCADDKDLGEIEEEYRLHIGVIQALLHRRLHVEWSQCKWVDKLDIVQQNGERLLELLNEIVTKYFSAFSRFRSVSSESWTDAMVLIDKSLLLQNHSVNTLRQQFIDGSTGINELIGALLLSDAQVSQNCGSCLVVVADASETALRLRPLTRYDHCFLVLFIDAIVATKVAPKVVYKPILNPAFPTITAKSNTKVQAQQLSEWNSQLPAANITFIGNVNSGKSSLSGRLLACFGIFNPAVIQQLSDQAQKLGHSKDVMYAWLMDRSPESRSTGFTILPTWAGFQSNMRRFILVDNPGHKDFARNATFGIFHADICVLVTSALMSEIDFAEMSASGNGSRGQIQDVLGGQALDHLLTAFTYGVRQLVVAVNKMDLIQYSQTEFERVRAYMLTVIKKIGYKESSVAFVPISVLLNDGILGFSEQLSWFGGNCLMQLLEDTRLPPRHVDDPFKLVVSQVYRHRAGGTVVCGKVERGSICIGDKVVLCPEVGQNAEGGSGVAVKSIHAVGEMEVECAAAGDDIGICLETQMAGTSFSSNHSKKNTSKKQQKQSSCDVRRGMVLYLYGQPAPRLISLFESQIFVGKIKQNFYFTFFSDCVCICSSRGAVQGWDASSFVCSSGIHRNNCS